jgi:hypothetical protein
VPAALGGAGLAVGAFAPAVVVDFYGPISLHDLAPLQALLVAAAGVTAFVAAPLRRTGWVRPAALVAWIGVLLPLLRRWLEPQDDSFLGGLSRAANEAFGDPLTQALADVALEYAGLSWGGAPLLGGLLLVSVAAWRVT